MRNMETVSILAYLFVISLLMIKISHFVRNDSFLSSQLKRRDLLPNSGRDFSNSALLRSKCPLPPSVPWNLVSAYYPYKCNLVLVCISFFHCNINTNRSSSPREKQTKNHHNQSSSSHSSLLLIIIVFEYLFILPWHF